MKTLPKDGWRLKRDSHSVLFVIFNDGNKRMMYSLDWNSPRDKHYDTEKGFRRFRDKINTWNGHIFKYWLKRNDNLIHSQRTLIVHYQNGDNLLGF